MRRPGGPEMGDLWKRRFQRFSKAGHTVAQFCQQEQISVASFYHWRKKLGAGNRETETAATRQRFLPVHVTGTTGVQVRLGNGVVVTLPAGDDHALRQTLLVLSQLPAVPQEAR